MSAIDSTFTRPCYALVRGQQPIIIPDHSEPEPDLTIVRNVNDNYLSSHPKPSDILVLI
jgi:hypothetical protein